MIISAPAALEARRAQQGSEDRMSHSLSKQAGATNDEAGCRVSVMCLSKDHGERRGALHPVAVIMLLLLLLLCCAVVERCTMSVIRSDSR